MSINRDALFADGTREYVSPTEPQPGDKVTLRFRAAHGNSLSVFLKTRFDETPMTLEKEGEVFDWYQAVLRVGQEPLTYIFRIEAADGSGPVLLQNCARLLHARVGQGSRHVPDSRRPLCQRGQDE